MPRPPKTPTPPRSAVGRKAHTSMILALRAFARERCNTRNCGTVCLCDSCHARRALDYYEPDWRTRI